MHISILRSVSPGISLITASFERNLIILIIIVFSTIWVSVSAHTISNNNNQTLSSGQTYLERFLTYSKWNQDLPSQPNKDFLSFIDSNMPLAKKLREKWLYQLASQKDWINFSKYYKNSDDVSLQCFAHLANYYQGNIDASLREAKLLWLTGVMRPDECHLLFDKLIKSEGFDENLISQRIILALDKCNIALARYLLKQYKRPRIKDEQLLLMIHQNPTYIHLIQPGELHNAFYLYGLKRMVLINMDQAIRYWQHPNTKRLLTQAEQQAFLVHIALYKAMRNHEDTTLWFAKIKPTYYSDELLDWQIRWALQCQKWDNVKQLVAYIQDKQSPCWQYWLARAMEKTHQPDKARELYQTLANNRHYYGFLASLRLNKKLTFQHEKIIANKSLLKPYYPVINDIKSLYNSKQLLQASRLLDDFISELPKDDKSALLSWVNDELQWYGKSVYLSNTEELNNQLSLRFPMPFTDTITTYSNTYQIPKPLIYAIIRQESGFRDDAVSSAGARGLMQIMPSTANAVTKQAKIIYHDKSQLFSSQKNINIGVAYLQQLARWFSWHPVLMAAAYNAGPRQVKYWRKHHALKEIDLWIETLSWRETRNYLKNVISFYIVYQYRMQNRSNLQSDLRHLMKPFEES